MASPTLLPLADYAATRTRRQPKVPKGLDALAHRLRGGWRRKTIGFSQLKEEAARIETVAEELSQQSNQRIDELLVARHRETRRNLGRPVSAEARRSAFGLLAEVIRRETGLKPYPEQILGALVMERGALAEMATGEGKTLTIGLAAAWLAWHGRPCHVITANDYLVERDADWLRPFYHRCGLEVGSVTAAHLAADRRAGYEADITYVTSKEVVADFLRDRLALGDWVHPTRRLIQRFLRPLQDPRDRTVMRGLHSAIIDEADHILIDEAVTPLIISRPIDNLPLETACRKASEIAADLTADKDYERLPRFRDVELLRPGKDRLRQRASEFPDLWRNPARTEELLRQALVAREFFRPGEQYVITEENKIAIIDESTGRLTPERTWRQGLHQAIEAKEGIPLTLPSETLSRLSFQRYFRFYQHLGGCTGTAKEAASEFWHIYRLPVFRIPTHRPSIRKTLSPQHFASAEKKREAITALVAEAHARQQPVLIGTRSVTESEILADCLAEASLPCRVLNASRHRQEAAIVAEAGFHGAITIATNMAGRGTDIKLRQGVEDLGGLLVIVSERHTSSRIDRQLIGRCARQGEPGQVRVFASYDDDLCQRFLPRWIRTPSRWLRENHAPGSRWLMAGLLRWAQRRATGQAYRERKQVPRQDEWLSQSLAFAGRDVDR